MHPLAPFLAMRVCQQLACCGNAVCLQCVKNSTWQLCEAPQNRRRGPRPKTRARFDVGHIKRKRE